MNISPNQSLNRFLYSSNQFLNSRLALKSPYDAKFAVASLSESTEIRPRPTSEVVSCCCSPCRKAKGVPMRSIGTADSNLLLNHFDFQLVIAKKTYDCHAASLPSSSGLAEKMTSQVHSWVSLRSASRDMCRKCRLSLFHANPFPVFVQINQTQCRASSDSYGSAFRRQTPPSPDIGAGYVRNSCL